MTGSDAPLDDVLGPLELPRGRRALTVSALVDDLPSSPTRQHVVGAGGHAVGRVAAELGRRGLRSLIVASGLEQARRVHDDATFLLAEASPEAPPPSWLVPGETSPYADVHPERQRAMSRVAALHRLTGAATWQIVVTTAAGLVRRVVPRHVVSDATVALAEGDEVDLGTLEHRLSDAGYLRAPLVEDPGSFAVRGGLLDVWAAGARAPVRVELYGDLVLGLRRFDPDTQRTLDGVDGVTLPPAREAILSPRVCERARAVMQSVCDAVNCPSTKTRRLVEDVADGRTFFGGQGYLPAYFELEPLWAYLPDDVVVIVEEPADVVRRIRHEIESARAAEADRHGDPHFPFEALHADEDEIAGWLDTRRTIAAHRVGVSGAAERGLDGLEATPVDCPTLAISDQADLERAIERMRKTEGRHGALDPLVARLTAWREHGLSVALTARTRSQAERLSTLLSHRDVDAPVRDRADRPLCVVVGPLSRGAVSPLDTRALVTEEEIFGHRVHKSAARKRSPRALLEDLRALTPGDTLVHAEHGIGRYVGLERKQVGSVTVELIAVEYAGGDKLFVPVHRMNLVQKYSGGDGSPRLDRLGGQTFAKKKSKVKRRVREMADELLRLYAERNALEKSPLPPPGDDYAALEASFPYEETPDQAAAIADVNRDLEQRAVMDRLVCGDVGFGKTEVALRAAFRNAIAGRQTALLCPTTVLAQQHYATFKQRLEPHAITVRAMSRFQTKADQTETIRGLRAGTVDVVVGTHRVLSKDVHFKSLGLVVVDEEQRFGVTHKERLKQLRTSVDVLTLTATPIPRTLQLAIGGLREMSVITTPPVDRRAIRTITSQYDEHLIQRAIGDELRRGGQVFYVYNRVEGIHERAARVQALLPEARVVVGHGQMRETTLERTMVDFVEGKYDVLVATAIIESGLDIPRANTMIVDRADLFGLGQLYQLRGRVGRSSERAYCYLLVPPASQLTDEARYRIEALERYTELGTGFHVASLDMEQRGFGNVLGGEQSGFVESVGFDLFCSMLEEATRELRGEPAVADVDPELSFDVEALLPESYVPELGVRLSLYKRLASASGPAEVDDIGREMEDRFGSPPSAALRLVDLMRIKTELRALGALGCEATRGTVTLHLAEATNLDADKIGSLVTRKGSRYRLSPDMRLTRRAATAETFGDGIAHAERALSELSACVAD